MKRLQAPLITLALAVFAAVFGISTAGATVLCQSSSTDCSAPYLTGSRLTASAEGSIVVKTGGGTTIQTCTINVFSFVLTNAGSTSSTVGAEVDQWTFSGCATGTSYLSLGTLEFHYTSASNGTVTSDGTSWTANVLGISCVFKTIKSNIGTLKGGNPATFTINATLPETSGAFGCPSNAAWTGSYTVTSPSATVDVTAG